MRITRLDTYNCWCGLPKRTHHHRKRQDNPIDPFDTPPEQHNYVPVADEEDLRCIRCDARPSSNVECI